MVAQSHDLGEHAVVVRACERKQGDGDKGIKAKMLPRAPPSDLQSAMSHLLQCPPKIVPPAWIEVLKT